MGRDCRLLITGHDERLFLGLALRALPRRDEMMTLRYDDYQAVMLTPVMSAISPDAWYDVILYDDDDDTPDAFAFDALYFTHEVSASPIFRFYCMAIFWWRLLRWLAAASADWGLIVWEMGRLWHFTFDLFLDWEKMILIVSFPLSTADGNFWVLLHFSIQDLIDLRCNLK